MLVTVIVFNDGSFSSIGAEVHSRVICGENSKECLVDLQNGIINDIDTHRPNSVHSVKLQWNPDWILIVLTSWLARWVGGGEYN